MAWAPKGDRAYRHDFFVRGVWYVFFFVLLTAVLNHQSFRYSILPAISLDGVLHMDILTRSWTGEEFRNFIRDVMGNMNPYPQRNSVLVMDNASTHHCEGLKDMVQAQYVFVLSVCVLSHILCRGMRLVYLPAYSPDLNPIEEGFSAMKAWIRQNRDYLLSELMNEDMCHPIELLWEAVYSTMVPSSIEGWFHDSGYVA